MTAELDLADLRRLLAATSALPWAVTTCGEDDVFADRHVMDGDGCHVGTVDTDQEALVIVAAVNALPALLDRVEAAEARIAALEAAARLVLPMLQFAQWPHPFHCPACGPLDRDRIHDRGCPVGVLAALLDGDA